MKQETVRRMAKSRIGYKNAEVQSYWKWEPLGYGCSRRCMAPRRCWAEQSSPRQRHRCPDCGDFKVHFHEERLIEPFNTKKAGITLTGFHADLFDAKRPDAQIVSVLQQIAECPWHTFVLLTQNAKRLAKFYQDWWRPDRYKYHMRGGQRFRTPRLFLRRPGCSECTFYFLGCLRGREEWKDDAVSPNFREAGHHDFFGDTEWICDGFEWSPNAQAHGVVVEMNAGEISVRQCDLLGPFPAPLKNIYHGCTIRTQAEADERLPVFLDTPGNLWVSMEPLWGGIAVNDEKAGARLASYGNLAGIIVGHDNRQGAPGTETLDHIYSVLSQCGLAGVNCYVKQIWHKGRFLRASHLDEYALYPRMLKNRDLPWDGFAVVEAEE